MLRTMLLVIALGVSFHASAEGINITCVSNLNGTDQQCKCEDKQSCDKMKSKDGGSCGKGTVYCNDKGDSCSCRVEFKGNGLNLGTVGHLKVSP